MAKDIAFQPVAVERGNNNDQARQHNLATVLGILRRQGMQTRAELTRRTGLNRSTIGALVGELVAFGLVDESAARIPAAFTLAEGHTARRSAGRPSPTVTVLDSVAAIAVNPDTDAVTVGLIGLDGTVLGRVRHATTTIPSATDVVSIVVDAVHSMMAGGRPCRIVGVGAAVPGLVSTSDSTVTFAPHLRWRNEKLAEALEDALGVGAAVGNDANLGAIAESLYGAGHGTDDFVYLNGSTSGIGGGVFSAGQPLFGAHGYGAELGHTRANASGSLCHCGRIGCFEAEVNIRRLLAPIGLHSVDLDGLDVLLNGVDGTRLRTEVMRQLDIVAEKILDFINVFDPQMVILGGHLGSLHDAAPGYLEMRCAVKSFASLPRTVAITRTQLGSKLLMIGAAEIAFAPLLQDPSSIASMGVWTED